MSDDASPVDPGEQRRLQRRIDRTVEGHVLYETATCPFCQRVRLAVRSLGIDLPGRDISQDAEAERALTEEGGKRMVPCLYIPGGADGQPARWLYESDDIIEYLRALVQESE